MQSEDMTMSQKNAGDQSVVDPPESFYFTDLEESLMANDNNNGQDRFCEKCRQVLVNCTVLEAMYCNRCAAFNCFRCKQEFNRKLVCKCNRCTCCFTEQCASNSKVGQNCQTMCSLCYEENEPTNFNLLAYPCGHKICRICVFQHTVNDKTDPRTCFICKE